MDTNPNLQKYSSRHYSSDPRPLLSSVQSLSCVRLFVTPWTAECQASVHHQLPEFTQTHVHWVHPTIASSVVPFSSAFNLSQHQGLFQWKMMLFASGGQSIGASASVLPLNIQGWFPLGCIRKHWTGGFLCAVLDLSGILCSLFIPEYSGIKRRGKPLPGLRNPGISFVSFSIRW